MMTDKIPSFKEQIDEIHVPMEKLDDIIFKTVQEHAPKRKKSWRSKVVYSASAAVVAFGLLVGSATVSPVMAEFVSKIPIIGSVFSESTDAGLAQVSELGFTQIIGEAKKVDDKILTIEEAFYDGVRLSVSYSLASETPIESDYFSSGPGFRIDGQAYHSTILRSLKDITPTYHTGFLNVEIEEELPDQFTLDLVFGGKRSERWEFSIPIQSATNVKTIEINHQQQVAGVNVTITEVSSGLGGLKLSYEASTSEEVSFFTSSLAFYIEDELGNEIAHYSGVGQGTDKILQGYQWFNPINEASKQIKITPYFRFPEEMYNEAHDEVAKKLIKEFEAFEHETFESITVDLSE